MDWTPTDGLCGLLPSIAQAEQLSEKARKRKGFGWTRWSTQWLYANLGLFNGYRGWIAERVPHERGRNRTGQGQFGVYFAVRRRSSHSCQAASGRVLVATNGRFVEANGEIAGQSVGQLWSKPTGSFGSASAQRRSAARSHRRKADIQVDRRDSRRPWSAVPDPERKFVPLRN